MCGHGKKAERQQARCARRCSPMQNRSAGTGGIAAIIGALQEIKLASHGIDSRSPAAYGVMPQMRTAELGTQEKNVERGVVHDFPSAAEEKKRFQGEALNFEELPSYEETVDGRSSSSSTSSSSRTQGEPIFTPATSDTMSEAAYHPEAQRQPHLGRSSSETAVLDNLEAFRSSLLSYSRGARGTKHDAKRAAKAYVRDLYESEMERRRAVQGSVDKSDRRSVKREVKPVKKVLKNAVWEAKEEYRQARRGQLPRC